MKRIYYYFFHIMMLVGCTTPMTPDLAGMSSKYAMLLEQYQINMVFANIMRSATQRPLSFLDMPTIQGSGTITNTPSLSNTFVTGGIGLVPSSVGSSTLNGLANALTGGWTLGFGNTFSFTQSSLDNAVFWKNFLTPLSIESLKYFVNNHIPRELAFILFIDTIEVEKENGSIKIYNNNPLSPQYAEFQTELYKLLNYGLTIEPTTLIENGKPIATFEVCMKRNQFENDARSNYGDDIFCKNPIIKNTATKETNKGPKLTLIFRSARHIYHYLGNVATAQLRETPYLVTLPPTEGTLSEKVNQSNQYALLIVKKNTPTKLPFAEFNSLDGNAYIIPSENNGYSQTVVDFLTQVQGLSKTPGSVPPSPAILIR
jgi:hypothetical protein